MKSRRRTYYYSNNAIPKTPTMAPVTAQDLAHRLIKVASLLGVVDAAVVVAGPDVSITTIVVAGGLTSSR